MTTKKQLLLVGLLILSFIVKAQTTHVIVRAKAKDAHFLGLQHTTKYGAAFVSITDAITGQVLAKGTIGTGAPGAINPDTTFSTIKDTTLRKLLKRAGKFEADVNITEPRFVTISITAPTKKRYAGSISSAPGFSYPKGEAVLSSTQLWLIPGKNIGGQGIVLEIPGFILDIQQSFPSNKVKLDSLVKGELPIKAYLGMECGCKITKGGTWNSDNIDVAGALYKDGIKIQEVKFSLTDTSLFGGAFSIKEKGNYEAVVYAFDNVTFNTSVDKVKFTVN